MDARIPNVTDAVLRASRALVGVAARSLAEVEDTVILPQFRALVVLASANAREEADAQAYGLAAMMKSFGDADPKILQALASAGMSPGQLMALAFRDLADNASKIGQLNVTPDLLREMLQPQTGH